VLKVRLEGGRGPIDTRYHRVTGDRAVLWVFGAGGGLGGPAGGLYSRLSEKLRPMSIASLRVDYRHPGRLRECVHDVLGGLEFLELEGKRRIVLVGHSFGGAVVIDAGAVSRSVVGVAALSSQTSGADKVGELAPRSLLLLHGTGDEILSHSCSEYLFNCASEPKKLILYPGCKHGLDQCRDAVDADLSTWIVETLDTRPLP